MNSWSAALGRLLLLRGLPSVPATARFRVLALLAIASLATWVGLDWYRNLPDPEFYPYALPAIAWHALFLLAISAVLSGLSKPRLDFGRVLTCMLAVVPVCIVVVILIELGLSKPWVVIAASALLCIYVTVYVTRALRAMSGSRQLKAALVGVLLTWGFVRATDALLIDAGLWYAPDDDDSDDGQLYDTAESLLFSQPLRIDEAVDRMAPSQAGKPSAFFLGFAGYADQRVFAEEVKLAARVVGQRFGSQNRSLLLINDRRSRQGAPLANPTALRYALEAIAEKMDLDQDVLFLAVSSHGSRDGSISVLNGSLMFHDLSASDLASALKETGFRWRVIVVSACYSGSFIEPLMGPGTAVITASAADRTSFGCSDDRDLTYFGEAFYRDALPVSRSLRDAFDRTEAAIVERERREGVEPSRPQAYFGQGIEEQVAKLEGRPDGLAQPAAVD